MIIRLCTDPESPLTLEEPDDLRRLHVEVVGFDAQQTAEVVMRFGLGNATSDDHADVAVTVLRELAGDRGPVWSREFESMLEYAASRGWMTDSGHVRAHCERIDDLSEMRCPN